VPERIHVVNLGRLLLITGAVLVIAGGMLILGSKLGIALGRLPGDVRIARNGGVLYLPCATSLMISILLTIVLNILLRVFRK
jgi:hypothetical protein